MKVADIVAQGMTLLGVERLFGNPGTTEMELLRAMDRVSLPFQMCLTEATAVAVADGYQRVSGRPSAVITHTAAGTAAAAMGVLNAYGDRQPLVVIAGDKDSRLAGRDNVAESADFAAVLGASAKTSVLCRHASEVAKVIAQAFVTAWSAPRGPAFVAVPEDLWDVEVGESELAYFRQAVGQLAPNENVTEEQVAQIAAALREAQRPVILFGNQFGQQPDFEAATSLVALVKAKVLDEFSHAIASVNYPQSRPEYCGPVKRHHPVLAAADLVLVIGSSLSREYSVDDANFLPADKKMIHISVSETDLTRANQRSELAFCASPLAVVRRLVAQLQAPSVTAAPVVSSANNDTGLVATASFDLDGLLDVCQSTIAQQPSTWVAESVLSTVKVHERLFFDRPHSYYSTTSAGLGWGLGFSAGVATASNGSTVNCLIGDGSFAFGIHALWTIASRHLPVVIIVINNGGYQAVREPRLADSTASTDCWTLEPTFSITGQAAAFGIEATDVSTPAEFEAALTRAQESGRPWVINARIKWRV